MGSTESIIKNNNDLVDNLMKFGYIRTKEVEQVFRAVDRANYVISRDRKNAYRVLAWKYGKIHLSAPHVYSKVMEGLCLKPGLSFLNIGSGTGYLSTMAGLILNQHGTNHGIELYEDCLKYAYERLEEFKQKSLALDEFDFCEPLFVQGNCLNVIPDRQYDRVYCGAACPESHIANIKQFVRIGGILVIPFEDDLLCVHRMNEDTWWQSTMIPVSFETLVVPTDSEQTPFYLPECHPLSLRELCRGNIRNRLREKIWNEHSSWLETKKLILLGQESVKKNNVNDSDSVNSEEANNTENSSSSMEEELDSIAQSHSGNNVNKNITTDSHSDENDSETTDDDDTFASRKQMAKREETVGKVLVNVNVNNDEDTMETDLGNIDIDTNKAEIITHHVNSKALSTYMMEKIHQLPLPFSLKLYINYNRQL
ncbi:protein-L-isoaspartate O-methyltransferase domain-containing protein 1-like isoform X2 [Colletes gigas]|nr:protein-L-isoaspartate O-methyltransferase domain-containing protein 1-like isoform X2 [Colletes gigas]XP_043252168.1 protein-L-isoaspartate O-methyltransferase domain-containing protein 1-like isoform X2 [Colletes gigas]XP_043252169.1 protein-L-isoaspartate O-methyltransferase domain-containing protein 1-like isoform X2 [Colletes gigas]